MGTTNDSSPADGEKAGAGARAERPAGTAPLFRAEDVSKSFAAIDALRQVGLDLERGTVHAIVGHNGAGKSTLMNILSGVLRPDSGRLLLDGESRLRSARRATRKNAGFRWCTRNSAFSGT